MNLNKINLQSSTTRNLARSFLCLILGVAGLTAEAATSVTQYGVTWSFDNDYQVGTFVNGDYYVIDPGNGVTVTKVTPSQHDGENGSMINPESGQAYDNEANAYNRDLLVTFPRTLKSGQSLVTAISASPDDEYNGDYRPSWNDKKYAAGNHVHLKTAAVLTVLNTTPPKGAFRPPYIGNRKPIFLRSQINEGWLVDVKAPPSLNKSRIEYLERGLQRPWIIHPNDFQARHSHPYENMYNYHRDIGHFYGEAACALTTNMRTEKLLVYYVQLGIDYYYMTTLPHPTLSGEYYPGTGDSSFWKWPIIHTGLLLGNAEIYQLFCRGDNRSVSRSNEKFYYVKNGTSSFESKMVPPGQTWTGSRVAFRKQTGNGEHEHAHPTEWDSNLINSGNGKKQESYRQCCDSRPSLGFVLAAIITSRTEGRPELKPGVGDASHANTPLKLWFPKGNTYDGNDTEEYPPFDYLYRWMTEDFKGIFYPVMEKTQGSLSITTQYMGTTQLQELWMEYGLPLWEGDEYKLHATASITKRTPGTPRDLKSE